MRSWLKSLGWGVVTLIAPTVLGRACLMAGQQTPVQELLEKRLQVRWRDVPKKVLAFYYGWYGNPKVSGRWHHWEDVDEGKATIGSSTHYPLLGPYDSHDREILTAHCRMAKEAGLDGFIFSWWHVGDFHDQGLPILLDIAEKLGMEVTIYFETVPNSDRTEALRYVLYLLNSYSRHPAWMKVGGKPVLFIYGRAIGEIGLDNWVWVISEAERAFGPAVYIGDNLSSRAAQIFDGIHTYNPTGETAGKKPNEILLWAKDRYPKWVATAGPDRIACATIIPGYDDRKLPDRTPPRPITERYDGRTYQVLWQAALEANPDWVLITSWNEWHEGSEIEPSKENGDRELKATRVWSEKFKALPLRKRE